MSMVPVRRHWENPPQDFTGPSVRRAFKRHYRRLTRLQARHDIEAGLAEVEAEQAIRGTPHELTCDCPECSYSRDFFALESHAAIAADPAAPLAAFLQRRLQRKLDLQLAS